MQAYFENRLKVLDDLKAKQGLDAYPHKWDAQLSIPEYNAKYGHLANDQRLEEIVQIAGRIMRKASSGTNLYFYDLRGESAKVQILSDRKCVVCAFLPRPLVR